MNVSRGLASLLLPLGAILALALSWPSAATPASQPPPADRHAGVLTTTTPTLVATGTPVGIASPTDTPAVATTNTATLTPTTPPTATAAATGTPMAGCSPGWHQVPAPDVGPLTGISAAAPNDIWAVGPGGVLRWNGSAWAQVSVPPATYRGVAALAATDVWVVGSTANSQTFTAHWDGNQWTVVPSPNPSSNAGILAAVTALAPNDVWAVGYDLTQGFTFALHWDGVQWAIYGLPSGRFIAAYSISGAGAADVWAVTHAAFAESSYISHWNGTQWDNQLSFDELRGVTAIASNDAWLVGRYDDNNAPAPVYHWNGVIWTRVGHPGAAPLWSVDASASNNVWAVGEGDTLHWDGSAWLRVPRINNGTLIGVEVVGPNDVWAVGSSNGMSLIEHYPDIPQYSDVPPTQPFYPFIQWMACRGYISGYTCGGPGEPCPGAYFRPGANVTRAQLLKMVVNAAGWPVVSPPVPTFADVLLNHPFFAFIETGASHGIISGYECGAPGEPCNPPTNTPYFRPYNDITRGQLSKVIALARGYALPNPATPTFTDVPDTHPFHGFIEAMAAQHIVSGYDCGGVGEPCDPANRPYFRPAANATRGQVSKFVTLAYGGP
jgi:hypothetical protein